MVWKTCHDLASMAWTTGIEPTTSANSTSASYLDRLFDPRKSASFGEFVGKSGVKTDRENPSASWQ